MREQSQFTLAGSSQGATPQAAAAATEVGAPAETEEMPAALPVPDTVDPTLARILGWRRGFDSPAEIAFMAWLREEIEERGGKPQIMALGCLVVEIPRPDGRAYSTLFSCHTDTVHWGTVDVSSQKIVYDPSFGMIFLDKEQDCAKGDWPNCLGADDGVGVWIMLNMITARVPGAYVFHRGEERGGLGADAMLTKHREWLSEFEVAVAFDRPRDNEVITHQGGQRCCSDKFAEALAAALNARHPLFAYKPSAQGMFTDTKIYRRVIAECTNLGAAYENQHGRDEMLNYAHAVALRDAAIKVNWDALPVDRDPAKEDYTYPTHSGSQGSWQNNRGGYYGRSSEYDGVDGTADLWGKYFRGGFETPDNQNVHVFGRRKKGKGGGAHKPQRASHVINLNDPVLEVEGVPFEDLLAFCDTKPAEAAALLIELTAEVLAQRKKVEVLRKALNS